MENIAQRYRDAVMGFVKRREPKRGESIYGTPDYVCTMESCGAEFTYGDNNASFWPEVVDHLLFVHHVQDGRRVVSRRQLAERVRPPYGYAIYPDREMYETNMILIGHDKAGREIKALNPSWAGPYNHRLQCLRGPHKKGNLVGAHKLDAYHFGEEKNYEAALRWVEVHEWEWHGGEPPGLLSLIRAWIRV